MRPLGINWRDGQTISFTVGERSLYRTLYTSVCKKCTNYVVSATPTTGSSHKKSNTQKKNSPTVSRRKATPGSKAAIETAAAISFTEGLPEENSNKFIYQWNRVYSLRITHYSLRSLRDLLRLWCFFWYFFVIFRSHNNEWKQRRITNTCHKNCTWSLLTE